MRILWALFYAIFLRIFGGIYSIRFDRQFWSTDFVCDFFGTILFLFQIPCTFGGNALIRFWRILTNDWYRICKNLGWLFDLAVRRLCKKRGYMGEKKKRIDWVIVQFNCTSKDPQTNRRDIGIWLSQNHAAIWAAEARHSMPRQGQWGAAESVASRRHDRPSRDTPSSVLFQPLQMTREISLWHVASSRYAALLHTNTPAYSTFLQSSPEYLQLASLSLAHVNTFILIED